MHLAGIYCRISQDRGGTALGVARQERDCRSLAESKGWRVVDVYIDNDVSASGKKPRPEYLRMCADVTSGRITAVVVWDVDRLTRKPRELEDWIDFADLHKLELASVGGELDLAKGEGRMIARMKGAAARYESDQVSRRAKAKHVERAQKGLPSGGGTRPYGFEEDRITHRIEEAEVVRRAAGLLLSGSSLRAVARQLSEEGHRTSTGRIWNSETLKRVVMRPRSAGYREHHGELLEAAWQPILDRAVWEQLRTELGVSSPAAGPKVQRKHHWTGTLRCWRCGGLLGVRRLQGKERYTCRSAHFNRWDSRAHGCQGTSIAKDATDSILDELLVRRVEREDLGSYQPSDETRELEVELAKVEARLGDLAEGFAEGSIDREAYRVASNSVIERLAGLRALLVERQRKARDVVRLDVAAIRDRWPRMEPQDRRAVIGIYVDRITVGPAVRGDNRFNPDRLTVQWS